MHHAQGTGQAGKIEKKQASWQEEKVHQSWSKCYGTKISQKAYKTEKKKRTEELRAFEKMSVSDSDRESVKSRSSEEGEV